MECVVLHKTLSHVAIAQCVIDNVLREELEAAMREWICGPQEFEPGARQRVKLALERARAAHKYVEELQGQAGQAAPETHQAICAYQETAPRFLSVFRF